jgi:hypothetical protein
MKHYYVNDNAQSNGDHEVHANGCTYLPFIISKTYLGFYLSAVPAVQRARQYYFQSNGCAYCCPEANTD